MATYWENSCSFGLRYVSWNKYLIVSLVFSHLGFWSGNLFLIAPFPDLCLLVPFYVCVPCPGSSIKNDNLDCLRTIYSVYCTNLHMLTVVLKMNTRKLIMLTDIKMPRSIVSTTGRY